MFSFKDFVEHRWSILDGVLDRPLGLGLPASVRPMKKNHPLILNQLFAQKIGQVMATLYIHIFLFYSDLRTCVQTGKYLKYFTAALLKLKACCYYYS